MPLPTVDTYAGQSDLSSQGESWATIAPADDAASINRGSGGKFIKVATAAATDVSGSAWV